MLLIQVQREFQILELHAATLAKFSSFGLSLVQLMQLQLESPNRIFIMNPSHKIQLFFNRFNNIFKETKYKNSKKPKKCRMLGGMGTYSTMCGVALECALNLELGKVDPAGLPTRS